ncbi:MAG: HAD-IIB family hydrolase [Clostridia bacterium]|nr:HAD-IIB family hydrolase [Clostridia bacterium]
MIIIASDFDGTLNYHGISEADKNAIEKFRQEGNKFGVVTGRDLEQALWVIYDLKKANLTVDFVICCTGAVRLTGDGEIVRVTKQRVGKYLNEILEYARTIDVGTFRASNELVVCFADPRAKIEQPFSAISEMTQSNAWFPNEDDAERFVQYVRKNHANDISIFRNGGSIDMPPVGISKVSGIYEYASQFENAKIVTVGDNVNDIPMIKEFDGYAVSNAKDELKEIANHHCDRIADMIEEIMKGNI